MATPPPTLQRGKACLRCRKRKMRCDGVKPACQQCIRAKKHDCCQYDDGRGKTRTQLLREKIERLEQRIRELEDPEYTSPSVMLHDPHHQQQLHIHRSSSESSSPGSGFTALSPFPSATSSPQNTWLQGIPSPSPTPFTEWQDDQPIDITHQCLLETPIPNSIPVPHLNHVPHYQDTRRQKTHPHSPPIPYPHDTRRENSYPHSPAIPSPFPHSPAHPQFSHHPHHNPNSHSQSQSLPRHSISPSIPHPQYPHPSHSPSIPHPQYQPSHSPSIPYPHDPARDSLTQGSQYASHSSSLPHYPHDPQDSLPQSSQYPHDPRAQTSQSSCSPQLHTAANTADLDVTHYLDFDLRMI